MKIVRFEDGQGQVCYGEQVAEGEIHHLKGSPFADGCEKLDLTATVKRMLAPVDPPNIIAIGANYEAHAKEAGKKKPDHPLVFVKLTTSVIAAGDPIVLPAEAPNEVDYEAELAVVIGRTARNVDKADALDYVLGYTCGHDVSARDCQLRLDGQWARGKSFDTFCPLGPWIETDLDPSDLRVRLLLNGNVMQDGRTSRMIFDIPTLVSYLSRQFTLLPGTVIMTGTPEGVGAFREPPVWLKDGDEVTVEVEGIGQLTSPVRRSS